MSDTKLENRTKSLLPQNICYIHCSNLILNILVDYLGFQNREGLL